MYVIQMENDTTNLSTEDSPVNWDDYIGEKGELRGEWYNKGAQYWMGIDPTVDGMLGGFGYISDCDITASKKFLCRHLQLKSVSGEASRKSLRLKKNASPTDTPNPPGSLPSSSLCGLEGKEVVEKQCPDSRALDCGAGIGRITKHLLGDYFSAVDMVDQCPNFTKKARDYVADSANLGDLIVSGLQDFNPQENYYDCVWVQWVSGYLPDDEFVKFLVRVKRSLRTDRRSMIFVKENITETVNMCVDDDDNSVTRSDEWFKKLFHEAGLRVIDSKKQPNFPRGLYKVQMYALQPSTDGV